MVSGRASGSTDSKYNRFHFIWGVYQGKQPKNDCEVSIAGVAIKLKSGGRECLRIAKHY